jgi:Protein of unknown function (DUF982)
VSIARFLGMSNFTFPHVTIKALHSGQMLNVSSIHEASELLSHNWPKNGGRKLTAARKACLDGFSGTMSVDAVRRAFIGAAKEVGIYVWEETGEAR